MTALAFLAVALLVVLAGQRVAFYGDALAEKRGWVGLIRVAATTSLPELLTGTSAARLGAFDLAVGNLLGSNLFNALVLAWDDLLYPGALFHQAGESHLGAVLVALATYGVLLGGMSWTSSPSSPGTPWPSLPSTWWASSGFTPCGRAPGARA